ncbi:MAG: NYN domain-containing protein [Planctomycetes bacterium]|nr:NYN domain-containing protein [Planctomycetota bacterium]
MTRLSTVRIYIRHFWNWAGRWITADSGNTSKTNTVSKKPFIASGTCRPIPNLYTHLQNVGFVLIFKPTLEIRGKIKGNVDAELVLQVMIEYGHFNQAIIVSGDGDFHCLVKYLMGKNKLAKLLVPNDCKFSSLYKNYRSIMAGINKLKEKLELR